MLRFLTVALVILRFILSVALAQDNDVGLGIILGEPTVVSAKLGQAEDQP